MMSFTKEFTIDVKAAPMTIPTPMSTAFPLTANSLNSLMIFMRLTLQIQCQLSKVI